MIISQELHIDLLDPVSEFKEISSGDLSGLTLDEIRSKYPDLVKKWESGLPTDMPDGETWKAFVDRVSIGIGQLKPYFQTNLLVVAHEGVMRAVAYQLNEELQAYKNLEGRWFNPLIQMTGSDND